MSKLHIVAALLLAAVEHVPAGEPFCARKINVWTGKRGESAQIHPQWLAAASAIAEPERAGGASGEYRKPHFATAPAVMPQIIARGLRSPDGLAIHPKTGMLYVSQEDSGVISAIVNGKPVTAINARTPIHSSTGPIRIRADPLRAPEGIAFSQAGELYVVEDRPGGRLLRFALDGNGEGVAGEDIRIPDDWSHIAWEGVATGPHDELLLSGSSAEYAVSGDAPAVFEGVLLYRDRTGNWWQLDRRPLRSFSQAAFSRDGTKIAYTCEVTGEISWMDLSAEQPRRGGSANYAAKSPEGLCILPDGRILVAEEHGGLFLVDPETDHVRQLTTAPGTLESLAWDAGSHSLLAADDRSGTIVKWKLVLRSSQGRYAIDRARFEPARTPRHIPDRCPEFLAKVLKYGGVDFSRTDTLPAFKVFAGRAPLVAVDAVTTPVGPVDSATGDPIVRIQAAVFRPNSVTVPGMAQPGPLAIVLAKTRSGKVIRTRCADVSAGMAAYAASFTQAAGRMRVTVPLAGAVGVSEEGVCNLHLMGMGEMPDFHLVLNPLAPDTSYVVVDDGPEGIRQYRLTGPRGEDLARNMVISFSKELAMPMRWLGRDEQLARKQPEMDVARMDLGKFAGAL